MDSKNSFSLDLSADKELAALFVGKQTGDKVPVKAVLVIGESSRLLVTGTIAECKPDTASEAPEAETETEDPEEEDDTITPASMVMSKKPSTPAK